MPEHHPDRRRHPAGVPGPDPGRARLDAHDLVLSRGERAGGEGAVRHQLRRLQPPGVQHPRAEPGAVAAERRAGADPLPVLREGRPALHGAAPGAHRPVHPDHRSRPLTTTRTSTSTSRTTPRSTTSTTPTATPSSSTRPTRTSRRSWRRAYVNEGKFTVAGRISPKKGRMATFDGAALPRQHAPDRPREPHRGDLQLPLGRKRP